MQQQFDICSSVQQYDNEIKQEIQKIQQLNHNTERLLTLLEDMELNIGVALQDYKVEHAQIHLICLLAQNNDVEARNFWKRQNRQYQQNDGMKGLYEVLKSVWTSKFDEIIPKANQAATNLQGNNMLVPLLDHLKNQLKNHNLKFIAQNYVTISIKEFSQLLAQNQEESRRECAQLNWKVDDKGFIEIDKSYLQSKEEFAKIRDQQMQHITNISAFLDSLK